MIDQNSNNLSSPTASAAPKPGAHLRNKKPAVVPNIPRNTASVPEDFGYITDTGEVWLRTGSGDRKIGEWQAGDAAGALQHFANRFLDLEVEVELLATRVASGTALDSVISSAQKIIDSLPTAAVIGDVDALAQKLSALIDQASVLWEKELAERAELAESTAARRQEILAEARELENSESWKVVGRRFVELAEEWDALPVFNKHTEGALWKSFVRSRDVFQRRRGAHFSELDKKRSAIKREKEKLIEQAQEVADRFINSSLDSHDKLWIQGHKDLNDLLECWKKTGKLDKNTHDKLWVKFKAALDAYYDARKQVMVKENEQKNATAGRIDELIDKYSAQISTDNLVKSREVFQQLNHAVDEVDGIKPDNDHKVFKKLKAIEHSLRDAENKQWKKDNPEAQARAAQFLEKVARLEEQAVKAEKIGDTQKAQELFAEAATWRQWAEAAAEALES